MALYFEPAAEIENALERLKPRTPYEEVGDTVKKTVQELMGPLAVVENALQREMLVESCVMFHNPAQRDNMMHGSG